MHLFNSVRPRDLEAKCIPDIKIDLSILPLSDENPLTQASTIPTCVTNTTIEVEVLVIDRKRQ